MINLNQDILMSSMIIFLILSIFNFFDIDINTINVPQYQHHFSVLATEKR